jgi:hypothetical protein
VAASDIYYRQQRILGEPNVCTAGKQTLTTRRRVVIEKPIVSQVVNKFLAFYVT